MTVHAIVIALNEEAFIEACIGGLYESCSGISVVTQYDRNWYGEPVRPDSTVSRVLGVDDPEGKIHLVVRRHTDEAAARNAEMLALSSYPARGVVPHATTPDGLASRYSPPDYFLVVDADEIFDAETLPDLIAWVAKRQPRCAYVYGYEYARTWNDRVPPEKCLHHRLGFVRRGEQFFSRRVLKRHSIRLDHYASKNPLVAALRRAMGIIDCPIEVGAFHHGALVKSREELAERARNHSEREDYGHAADTDESLDQATVFIPTENLPINMRAATWTPGMLGS